MPTLESRSCSGDVFKRAVSLDQPDKVTTADFIPHGYCVLSSEPLLDTLRAPLVSAMRSGNTTEDSAVLSTLLHDEATWATIREQQTQMQQALDLPACDFNPHIIMRYLVLC